MRESSPVYVKSGNYCQKYQACFALKENVIKIFEVEFCWAEDNGTEEEHTTFLTNYKLLIPKDIFSEETQFRFHSNYNTFNNIKGTVLEINKNSLDLTSTPETW